MPLDPYFTSGVEFLRRLAPEELTDPALPSRLAEHFVAPRQWVVPDIEVRDTSVPSSDGHIPVRIYRPRTKIRSCVLWLHGGGFAHGDLDMPEAHMVSAEIAYRADAFVVSVDYRLAKNGIGYPAPVDDAEAVWSWLSGLPEAFRQPIALGGASAGAAIALSTALRLRNRDSVQPSELLLAYPFLHFPVPALDDVTALEIRKLPALMRFTPESIAGMVRNYVGRISDLPVEAMPGAADLTGLPPIKVLVSELDDLRPSAELIVMQSSEAGVPVETHLAAGMPHGHLNHGPSIDEVSRSLDFLVQNLGEGKPSGP
ncbi:alpha/beta hydrolase fold domain-containing protein [Arthrobacter sp. StoSoilB22]|uniref:alpha/beta hydrolase fold domain-containing protein n=1 Tax=Arthrobacter sp. StoSoilB22 TaxID=2830996 RepID=UPI001CC3C9A7|nr:alpha/beta hydrolase fold domain-containing protein [Arthrobacter sp. StoSoilB22]BCW62903.1 esterase [Arthrobacter sp. StoSoilB22]